MELTARNGFPGTVKSVDVGAVNAVATVEIAPGLEVTSVITWTSCERLGLAAGKKAYGVVKASNVMVGVDLAQLPFPHEGRVKAVDAPELAAA